MSSDVSLGFVSVDEIADNDLFQNPRPSLRIVIGRVAFETVQRTAAKVKAEQFFQVVFHSELRHTETHDVINEVRNHVPTPFPSAATTIPLVWRAPLPTLPATIDWNKVLHHASLKTVPAKNKVLHGSGLATLLLWQWCSTVWA